MALQNSQYDALMRYYQKLRLNNKRDLDKRVANAYHKIPRLSEIDREIASISMKKARLLLGESDECDFDLEDAINSLSLERAALLEQNGFEADYLKMRYTCPICQDTGYVENQRCVCLRKAISEQLYTQSNMRKILGNIRFSDFSLDYYAKDIINKATGQSAYDAAVTALERSRSFVRNFDRSGANLFLYGDTGVGKTFLSCCIARELLDSMHSVVYYSAFDLFEVFARSTFSASEEAQGEYEFIFDCDLLIIDDLGTELTNNFVASQFFLCINERILRKKSTIISTNLDLGSFMERYSERVFSRVSSNYTMLKLYGNDIRIQKKLSGGN